MGPTLYPINADKVENIDRYILRRTSDHRVYSIQHKLFKGEIRHYIDKN
ncbi:hypothetical protein [Sphingobacterium sp. BIGb0165]|nr:hypothetical protein [Sphingobacterium sp. BIGb0165]MCS4226561.1 hypothetical protein [Sphingobacterium sp. BIGb0165]